MNKIRILPDNLSNQIAAGEVVERPASVIKELIENSLDAGATRIRVESELGGRRLMRIVDDGEGMARDDAILAFERHATSKIKTLDDLAKIQTLGFRGEALASIASVAKVELITKNAVDQVATRVLIEGGKLIDVRETAHPQGTSITVRDLFFNTPARRKFMRSEATENYHLAAIITHYALAHPEIAFTFKNNGREIIQVAKAANLRERAFQLFGANLIESLLPVEGGREFIAKIKGFVSAPRERRSTRDSQYFFINGRFVRDKLLAKGLSEGFRAVLPHGVFPVAFLFLDIPLEEVDVNVHPAKTEVRFRRPDAVKEIISEAIRAALGNAGIVNLQERNISADRQINELSTPDTQIEQSEIEFSTENIIKKEIDFSQKEEASEEEISSAEQKVFSADFEQEAQQTQHFSAVGETLEQQHDDDFSRIKNLLGREEEANIPQTTVSQTAENNLETSKFAGDYPQAEPKENPLKYKTLPPLDSGAKLPKPISIEEISPSRVKPIGQLHDSFIIAVDDEGLLLIDQHVAHERILFDKFRRREDERKIESQNLLLPETIDLTPAQVVAFDYLEPELETLGFSLMRLSGRTIAVKSIPVSLPPGEVRNLLGELIDTIEREKKGNAVENIRDNIAASLACKAAVKINMKLTAEKMQWLIDRLVFTTSPTTCPHGRPIVLRLTMRDIERAFHRP